MKAYTDRNLTDPQLCRLSQVVNGRPNNWGMAFTALESKGLVWRDSDGRAQATQAGRNVLVTARREGW